MSSGTNRLINGWCDDCVSSIKDIGFTFHFMGIPYTQFSVNSNGQMRLGLTSVGSAPISTYAANTPILAPMSGDNEEYGGVNYKVIGSAPNRILVVEWKEFYVYFNDISGSGNMQALLYEASGKIEYIYGSVKNSSTSSVTRSIFISSSNTSNKSGSVSVAATPTYATAATPTLNTFAANVVIANLGTGNYLNRRVYIFTPPAAPTAPTNLTFSGI